MADSDMVFDAGAFMQSEGLTLKDVISPGVMLVQGKDGQDSELDLNAFMKSEGISGVPVDYNTPGTALETSPVGVMDRLRLSFGNTKGSVDYLKKNFQNATVGEDGDLLVQNHGVWQKVDPSGFSNGDGWSASEIMADAADLGKDALLTAGTMAGAAVGALGVGVGAIPGAGAGAAIASTASAALGRFLGTYQVDSPLELVKDIGMDTGLAMLGEGVAIGAKNTILPAVKSMFSKAGETLAPEAKNMVAKFISKTTGMSENSAITGITDSSTVGKYVDDAVNAAKGPQSLLEDSIFNESVGSSVIPNSSEALDMAARKQMHSPMRALIGDANGTDSIQKRFSAKYRGKVGQFTNSIADDAEWSIAEPLSEGMSELGTQLHQLGVLDSNALASGKFLMKPVNEIATLMGNDVGRAKALRDSASKFLNMASSHLDEGATFKGKPGAAKYLETIRSLDDTYYDITDAFPQMRDTFTATSSKMKAGVINAAPQQTSLGVSGPKAAMGIAQWYGERRGVVGDLTKAAQGGVKGLDRMISQFNAPASRGLSPAQMFEVAGELMPSKEAGVALMKNLRASNAAREILSTVPNGAAMKGGLAARAVNMMAPSPKTAFQAVRGSNYGLLQMNKMFKTMTPVMRSTIMSDPSKLAAILSTATGEEYDPTAK